MEEKGHPSGEGQGEAGMGSGAQRGGMGIVCKGMVRREGW